MDISAEKYVSLNTFRRNGEPVATPVWIVSLGDNTIGFTTESNSGKAKRLRNNPAVTLQACDVRGRLRADAPIVHGTAVIAVGADHDRVWRAVKGKYRIIAPLIGLWGSITGLFRKGAKAADSAIIITLTLTPAP